MKLSYGVALHVCTCTWYWVSILLFIQYERQSEKQEVEELLDRVDTELKDIWAALAKSVSWMFVRACRVWVCMHVHVHVHKIICAYGCCLATKVFIVYLPAVGRGWITIKCPMMKGGQLPVTWLTYKLVCTQPCISCTPVNVTYMYLLCECVCVCWQLLSNLSF